MIVLRSNKVEQRESKKDDRRHFEIYEKLYSEAAAQIDKEYESKMKKYKSPRKKLSDIDDGEELWNFLEHSSDGISFEVRFFLAVLNLNHLIIKFSFTNCSWTCRQHKRSCSTIIKRNSMTKSKIGYRKSLKRSSRRLKVRQNRQHCREYD